MRLAPAPVPGLVGAMVVLGWVLPARAADVPSASPAQLATLQEILARPEFQAGQGRSFLDGLLDPVRTWLRWLGSEIWQFIVWLLSPISNEINAVVGYGTIAIGVVILLVVAVLLHRYTRGAVADDVALAVAGAARPPRAAEELARARALAQAGQARRAVHHHYRAVLLRLDERDLLRLNDALTNQELLPRLADAPTLAGPFAELVARFDRLWYGQTDCSPEEYASFASLADRVWQGAGAA